MVNIFMLHVDGSNYDESIQIAYWRENLKFYVK